MSIAECRRILAQRRWRAFLAARVMPVRPDLDPSAADLVRADRDRRSA